jgi:CubicO group peptidase (beta-lactamase class C family)
LALGAAGCGGTPEAGTNGPSFDFAAVDDTVATFVAASGLNGAGLIIVHREFGVIHHEHWGVFDEDRVSLIASSTKMVTAGVLLRLQDDGLLDIDMPIAEYVEWGVGNPEITTAQLLSNSSGLIGLFEPNPYTCMWVSDTTLQECAAEIMTTEADNDDVIPPDTRFRYGGGQWQVAGGVAEAVSGKSWNELVHEIYVQACGLEVFGYSSPFDQVQMDGFKHPPGFKNNPDELRDSANPSMEAGAYTNTTDYGKLLLMHLRGGMCDNTRVLSSEALTLMHRDRIGAVYDGDAFGSGTGYGMGWWVDRSNGHISDGGAFGSAPWLDLDDGYGVFVLTESSSETSSALAGYLRELIDTAIAQGLA